MRMTVGVRVAGALLLTGAALLARREAALTRSEADAWQQLVTLRYEAAATASPPSGALAAALGDVVQAGRRHALVEYWLGRYDALADQESGSTDPDVLFVAANAAYRALRRDGGNWQTVVGRLDGVVKNYADVLRENPDSAEAAFNFEYATRLSAAIAARRRDVAPVDYSASGNTIHGGIGEVPVDADAKQFKMIVPMRPDERQEAEKAGKGGTRVRKG
jgi:hypothetical protein